jgi:hypothetical protein
MTQWARCLPEFGWQPFVLTRYYGHRATPELLAKYVHPDVRVEYLNAPPEDESAPAPAPAPAPAAGRASLASRVKRFIGSSPASALLVPDPGIGFWRSVRPRVLQAAREFEADLLVTTGPPHSNHDVGLWLAREIGIPWVADFRDPYIIDQRFAPRFPFRWMMPAHRRYSRNLYSTASLVTHAIPIAARFWRIRSADYRRHVRIMTNACAPELATGDVEPDVTPGGRRSIRAVGHIGHDEAAFLATAIAELVREGMDLELRLIGPPVTTLPRIRELLGERVISSPGMRHDLALRQVAGADVLVNYLSRERSQHYLLSSKLFEYLATGKPVIEVNPTVPDRQILRRLPDVVVLREPTLPELKESLRRALRMGVAGMGGARAAFVREHEWRRQVRTLAAWFDEAVERRARPSEAGDRAGGALGGRPAMAGGRGA